MKVLVTGHRGYIGSVLVPLLQAHDHEVHGLDTDLFRACTFDGELSPIPEVNVDVRDVTIDHVGLLAAELEGIPIRFRGHLDRG